MILPWQKTASRVRLNWRWIIVPILLLTWGEFLIDKVAQASTPDATLGVYWPNAGYWVAARLAWEGQPAAMYDDAAFQQASQRLMAYPDTFAANLPTTALFYQPLAGRSSHAAIVLWSLFSLGCFLLVWVILLYTLRIGGWVGLALSALVPWFEPWRLDTRWGQMYGVMLLLVVVGALGTIRWAGRVPAHFAITRPRPAHILAGVILGVLCIAKLYYGAVLLLAALLRRQGTVVAVAGGVFGAAALATILWWGPGLWTTAIPISLNWRTRPETAVIAYQSLNNFLMRVFHYDPTWNPVPVVNIPDLVSPLWWGLALLILLGSLRALVRPATTGQSVAEQLLQPALAVPLALLLAPISLSYHFVLALFPLLVVGVVLHERRAHPALWGVFAGSVILIGASLPYNVHNVVGAEALLHYPRLYGTLLLWGLILALLRPQAQPATHPQPLTPRTVSS